MATYLNRTSKLFDISRPQTSNEMNLRDLMCPVCRGILIEPVTLPCTHNLCLRCLKGTFEHNSLSCPLCRVRVGSWLRTATKSESLVNAALWELIRSRYPKEIEDKHNDDDVTDIDCDTVGYTPKILSAVGEIRREYEMQLHIAEIEKGRQHESERIVEEELICKIDVDEEKQTLAQLAQHQLLAKTLAKKKLLDEQQNVKSSALTNDNEYSNHDEEKLANLIIDQTKMDALSLLRRRDTNLLLDMKRRVEPRKSNLNLLSKIQAERLALGIKSSILNKSNDTTKSCCDYTISCHSIVTLKHQSVTMLTNKSSCNYISEPGCSSSKIYGDQNEEELRVPSDVLNSITNKKSLGIEICVQSQTTTITNDDKRIGSAQSAGSHDSINPEIHHFKPIKAIPRTPLKISQDGRQIDPKLLRVVPILKRISNPILKPPSQHMKRTVGCSWSAFKERVRRDTRPECSKTDWKSPGNPIQYHHQLTKMQTQPQTTETARKLDLVLDMSFDANKNYAKGINRLLNGTKVSKKLILDDTNDENDGDNHDDNNEVIIEPYMPNKTKRQVKNGLLGKRKQKHLFRNIFNNDEMQNTSSCCSTIIDTTPLMSIEKIEARRIDDDEFRTIENIAERIKRRKVRLDISRKSKGIGNIFHRKSTRNRALGKRSVYNGIETVEEEEGEEGGEVEGENVKAEKSNETANSQRNDVRRTRRIEERDDKHSKVEPSIVSEGVNKTDGNWRMRGKRVTRNSVRLKTFVKNDEHMTANDKINDANSNECVKNDQERIERLVVQEKKDYELARRLQATFNEMERISGRTRGSKRALECNEIALSNIDTGTTSKLNGKSLSNNSVIMATSSLNSRRRHRRN